MTLFLQSQSFAQYHVHGVWASKECRAVFWRCILAIWWWNCTCSLDSSSNGQFRCIKQFWSICFWFFINGISFNFLLFSLLTTSTDRELFHVCGDSVFRLVLGIHIVLFSIFLESQTGYTFASLFIRMVVVASVFIWIQVYLKSS